MTRLAIVLLAVVALGVQDASERRCDGSDYDGTKPWNRGCIEHACSRDGHAVGGDETKEWHACDCKHQCAKDKPDDDHHARGMKWDAQCKARCNPKHCHCQSPCGQT